MDYEVGEAHQFGEDIGERTVFGGASLAQDGAVVGYPDDPLVLRDRMDDADPMPGFEKSCEFLLHLRQAAGLNLDQQVVPNQVDHETVDGVLDQVPRLRVPAFQGSVEGLLAEGSDVRHEKDRKLLPNGGTANEATTSHLHGAQQGRRRPHRLHASRGRLRR